MNLFKAAKKEVSDQQAAIEAARLAQIESIKSQMMSISKLFEKIPSPSAISSTIETSSSITLSWLTPSWNVIMDLQVAHYMEIASESCSRNQIDSDEIRIGIGYEVRYYKTGQSLASWTVIKDIDKCQHTVTNLQPNSSYTFEIRANLYAQAKSYPGNKIELKIPESTTTTQQQQQQQEGEFKDSSSLFDNSTTLVPRCYGSSWSDWYANTSLMTLTSEQHERNMLEKRLDEYINNVMKPYPPYIRADTAFNKVERVGDATLNTLSKVPFLGSYGAAVKAAKALWDVRKIGIVSLVFSQDLAQVAAVLAGLASTVRTNTSITTKDMTVGAYYLLWIRRGIRLVNPNHEAEEHYSGAPGVILSQAPTQMLKELAWYAPLAFASYGKTPDHVQWLAKHHPPNNNMQSSSNSGSNNKKVNGFTLVGSSPWSSRVSNEKGVYKPAYNIMANRELNVAVFSIRGSTSVEDFLTDADANLITDVELCGVKGSCHGGMLKSAQWLAEEGGICNMMKKLHDDGHTQIVFTGHSLGAGVACLLALLTKSKYGLDMLDVSVYGFAMPPCLDEGLANSVCGCGVSHVADGVVVRSLVNKDDIVSRLSLANATELALEIQARRDDWTPFLSSDLNGVMQRAMTLWAPHQRGASGSGSSELGIGSSGNIMEDGKESQKGENVKKEINDVNNNGKRKMLKATSTYDPSKTNQNIPSIQNDDHIKGETKLADALLKQNTKTSRLVVPGSICHTYTLNGQTKCALINHYHPSLRRIEAYSTCTRDHDRSSFLLSMREVFAARSPRCKKPKQWEPMMTDSDVTCSCCGFHVQWQTTGTAATETARATHHCRSCGQIVCKECSKRKICLPNYGMLGPRRICDVCYSKSPMEYVDDENINQTPKRWEPKKEIEEEEEEENEAVDSSEKWY
jgi:hypothetical protein